jgi:cytochrome b pre-mRNA-processing protein 3
MNRTAFIEFLFVSSIGLALGPRAPAGNRAGQGTCARALELPLNARDMAAMSLLQRLFTPKPDQREALRPLWQAVVDEARRPEWYARLGATDSVAGRFDMVTAVLSVVLVRMEASDALKVPSVMLTELFVADMDGQLREFGVGDPVVGKHVGKLVGAMGGRLAGYRDGLAGGDAPLAEAVRRNFTLRSDSDADSIAQGLQAWSGRLGRTSDAQLLDGSITP